MLSGELTPKGHENLVRLSGWVPFEKAVALYEALTGVRVSDSTSRRYTQAAGRVYEEQQNEEAAYLEKEKPEAPQGGNKIQLSADGAMVPVLHGQWREVRTLVIGEVAPPVKENEKWVVHTRKLSYFSRKVTSEEFEGLSLVEVHRRGVENAKEVAAVMDGAEWLQSLTDYHRPDATRILDFPHASEHISLIGQYLLGEGTPEARQWLEDRLHTLKQDGPEKIMEEIRALKETHPQAEVISGNLAYLEKRIPQMNYPIFRPRAGLSGVVLLKALINYSSRPASKAPACIGLRIRLTLCLPFEISFVLIDGKRSGRKLQLVYGNKLSIAAAIYAIQESLFRRQCP